MSAVADWPDWLADAAQTSRVRHRDNPNRTSADVEAPSVSAVVELLDLMPNPDDTSRDVYLQVMLAARGCSDDPDIGEAAVRWADKWCGSPGEDVEAEKWQRDFAHCDAPLAGWSNLLAAAAKLGVDVARFRALAPCEFDAIEPVVAKPPTGSAARLRMRDRIIHPVDCATGPRRGYVVKGLIAPFDVGAIIGAPGTGKSQLAPYLAYAVAQGRPVFGLRTKPGRVLYLAAEDMTGMRQRVHALRLDRGDARDFGLVDCGDMRSDMATRADLVDTVTATKYALVVVDTVSAAFAGMDENDSAGMGDVVALARKIAATGAAVILVHHIAKNGDGTPRGHSVLNGTLDMCLSLAGLNDDKIVRGKLSKNRNGPCDLDIAFISKVIVLGQDEDGDDITAPIACELPPMSAETPRRPKLSPQEARGLAIMRELSAGGAGVSEQAWRDECENQRISTSEKASGRRKVVCAVLKQLLDNGAVRASGDMLIPVTEPEPNGTMAEPSAAVPGFDTERIEDLAA
jgi:hypothetical protein